MSLFSKQGRYSLSRLLAPRTVEVLDEELTTILAANLDNAGVTSLGAKQIASFNAQPGLLYPVDATAGAIVATAPDPTTCEGQSWGFLLEKTASAHTVAAAAHATEEFNLTTPPAATSTVGAKFVFTSDGTNWLITGKI